MKLPMTSPPPDLPITRGIAGEGPCVSTPAVARGTRLSLPGRTAEPLNEDFCSAPGKTWRYQTHPGSGHCKCRGDFHLSENTLQTTCRNQHSAGGSIRGEDELFPDRCPRRYAP